MDAHPPLPKPRSTSPSAHSKPCSICHTPRDVLVRCQASPSSPWQFLCPGKCWRSVSGGVVDGDMEHREYRYGGMWKNKRAGVSAKMPKKVKDRQRRKGKGKEDGDNDGVEEGEGEGKGKGYRSIADDVATANTETAD